MKPIATIMLGLALAMLAVGGQMAAAGPAPQATGKPAGVKVPISFAAPHGYAAVEDYLKKVASANPAITDLIEIGRSASGRPIHVLVVSNQKTGVTMDGLVVLNHPRAPATNNVTPMKPYQGKPAQWIDGGVRGTDPIGAEACLYIIDKLVTGYGGDPEIARLVDGNAFYICPIVNPDASGAGPGAKPPAAVDANGNFPEGWWKDDATPGGTGEYPSAMPEAKAILEFFTNHTNILLVESFDTTGGYSLRPFARWPDSRVNIRDLAVLDRVLGKKYLELVGEPVPASWTAPIAERTASDRAAAAVVGRGGRGRGATPTPSPAGPELPFDSAQGRQLGAAAARSAGGEQSRAWRSAYTTAPAGYGVFIDWAYGQFGAFSVATQLSDTQRDSAPMSADRVTALCETAWQFERYKATLLPKMEIRNATAKVLYTTNAATRAVATQEGDTVTVKKSGAPGTYKVVQVTATVENTGGLPTQVADGPQLRGNREDVIWLLGDKTTFLEGTRWMRLGVLQGTLPLPAAPRSAETPATAGRGGGGRGGAGQGATPLAQMREQRVEAGSVRQAGNRREVSWLVAVEGTGPLRIALTSQKGGTVVRELTVQ